MIHDVNNDTINTLKNIEANANKKHEEILFTFDDGLYSQYKYMEELNKLKTKKIFFISLNIIRNENEDPDPNFIKCADAHNYYFKTGSKKYYMSYPEIKELSESSPNNLIGMHGYNHLEIIPRGKFNTPIIKKHGKKLVFKLKKSIKQFIELDIIRMFRKINFYDPELKIFKPLYCYPYNNDNLLSKTLIQKHSIFKEKIKFYGKKRIDL